MCMCMITKFQIEHDYKVSHRTSGLKFKCQIVSTIKPPVWTRTDISAWLSKYRGKIQSFAEVWSSKGAVFKSKHAWIRSQYT